MPEEVASGINAGQRLFGRYVARQFVKRSQRSELWIGEDREARRWVQLVVWASAVRADAALYGRLQGNLARATELDHPNIVRVFEALDDGKLGMLVMEAPEGRTWEQMLRERRPRPFEPDELSGAVRELTGGLEHAWMTQQMAHGGIRPAQVIIGPDGSAKLQGYGLAPEILPGEQPAGWQEGIDEHLVYLSPERLRGGEPTPRDDVYGLGMCLYRMVVGKPPFIVRSISDALRQTDPPPLTDQRFALGIDGAPIPQEWETVVLDCIARDPSRRPATPAEACKRLLEQGRPLPPPTLAAIQAEPTSGVPAIERQTAALRVALRTTPSPAPEPSPEPRVIDATAQAPVALVSQPPIRSVLPAQPATHFQGLPRKSAIIPEAAPAMPVPAKAPLLTPRDPRAEEEPAKPSKARIKRANRGMVFVLAGATLLCLAGLAFRFGLVEKGGALLGLKAPGAKAPAAVGRSHLVAGQALFGENKIEAAVSEFSLALQNGEDRAEALYWRGRCYILLRNFDAAISELGSAIEARAGFAMAHLFRGFALGRTGRIAEALEDFNMAIVADPSLAEAYHHRGSALLELGQYDKALEDLNRVVKTKPGFAAYYDRGLAHFHLGRLVESIADFDEAIKENPKFALALYNRGSVYFQMERYREAVRDFSEAVRVNPRYENAFYMRGVANHRLGDHLRAIEDLSEAIRLRPNFKEAWEQRGFARLAAGDYHKANGDFEHGRKVAAESAASAVPTTNTNVSPSGAPPSSQRLLDPKTLMTQPTGAVPRP